MPTIKGGFSTKKPEDMKKIADNQIKATDKTETVVEVGDSVTMDNMSAVVYPCEEGETDVEVVVFDSDDDENDDMFHELDGICPNCDKEYKSIYYFNKHIEVCEG